MSLVPRMLRVLPLLALMACHGDVEMTPLVDRKIHITDRFYDVQAVTPEHVIVVGYGGKVLDSHDAGRNWEVRKSGTDNALFKVHLVNGQTGWAMGQAGSLAAPTR